MSESTPSPKGLKDLLGDPAARDRRRLAELERVRAEGRQEGREQARKEILDILQDRYMVGDFERGSAEGKAVLKMAKEISEHFRNHTSPLKRNSRPTRVTR